jgi:hypothetical protein
MPASVDLRGFVERLLGWGSPHVVELAVRSLELAAEHRTELVLCGAGDLVPIVRALHRRTLGSERPLVVCDPRRGNMPASPRSPANYSGSAAALSAAAGGWLCVRARRLPRDFSALAARLRGTDDVQLVVCAGERDAEHPFLVRSASLHLPPLAGRAAELDRVIAEYAADAVADLGVAPGTFTDGDHAWVRQHATSSLPEIEKVTLRIAALRASSSMSYAAGRLGVAPVSLTRWIDRRKLRPVLAIA